MPHDVQPDAPDHSLRFKNLIFRFDPSQEFSTRLFRPKGFGHSLRIVLDQGVRCLQNHLGGSVILFQTDHFHIWKILLKLK